MVYQMLYHQQQQKQQQQHQQQPPPQVLHNSDSSDYSQKHGQTNELVSALKQLLDSPSPSSYPPKFTELSQKIVHLFE